MNGTANIDVTGDSLFENLHPVDEAVGSNMSIYYSIKSNDSNLADCSQTILMDEIRDYFNLKWWVNGVITLIVSAFGMSGNLVSFCVLMQPKMRSASFNQLLAVLCVVDSIFLITNALACGSAFGVDKGPLADIGRYSNAFVHVSMCASVLLIVAFTFERHFAIRSPHQYRIHIRTTWWLKHLSMYVVPVTILSFFFNIPMFINLERTWLEDPTYVRVNLYLRILHPLTTTGLAPMLILVVLNARICRGILMLKRSRDRRHGRPQPTVVTTQTDHGKAITTMSKKHASIKCHQSKHSRELNMTYIAFGIVVIFFCLNLPRIVIGAYEVSETWLILKCIEAGTDYMSVLTFYKADTVARLLMVINSSINFLVYCAGSSQFQNVFCDLFVPVWCQRLVRGQSNSTEETENGHITLQVTNIQGANPSPEPDSSNTPDPQNSLESPIQGRVAVLVTVH